MDKFEEMVRLIEDELDRKETSPSFDLPSEDDSENTEDITQEAPSAEGDDVDEDEVEQRQKENDEEIEEVSKELSEDQFRDLRDKLIETFNTQAEKSGTKISLETYEPYPNYIKSFKAIFSVEKDEPYLDRASYEAGTVDLGLNDVFYADIKSISKRSGIDDINWKNSEDGVRYGTIIIKEK